MVNDRALPPALQDTRSKSGDLIFPFLATRNPRRLHVSSFPFDVLRRCSIRRTPSSVRPRQRTEQEDCNELPKARSEAVLLPAAPYRNASAREVRSSPGRLPLGPA